MRSGSVKISAISPIFQFELSNCANWMFCAPPSARGSMRTGSVQYSERCSERQSACNTLRWGSHQELTPYGTRITRYRYRMVAHTRSTGSSQPFARPELMPPGRTIPPGRPIRRSRGPFFELSIVRIGMVRVRATGVLADRLTGCQSDEATIRT